MTTEVMTTKVNVTTYVVYIYSDNFLFRELAKPINLRNPQKEAKDAPYHALGFRYYYIASCIVDIDGENVETVSRPFSHSKTYYIDAEILTDELVEKTFEGSSQLMMMIIRGLSGSNQYVRCRTGDMEIFNDGTELVSTS